MGNINSSPGGKNKQEQQFPGDGAIGLVEDFMKDFPLPLSKFFGLFKQGKKENPSWAV